MGPVQKELAQMLNLEGTEGTSPGVGPGGWRGESGE